jgi:hypothetical protein
MTKLLVLIVTSVSTTSFALPIAWEPFNYTYSPGGDPSGTNLVGRVNPGGLAWYQAGPVTGGTNVPSIYPGNLSYPGLAPATGNAIKFGGIDSGGMAARFSKSTGTLAASGTLYYSFIMKVTDITGLSTSGVFCAGFNNSANSQATLPNVVAARLYARATNGGFVLGTSVNSSTASDLVWDTTTHNINETNFVVGSYQMTGSPFGTSDSCQMWINPDPSTFNQNNTIPAATLTTTTGGALTGSGIASYCVYNRNAGEFKSIILDQLTIGTSWADVTLTNVPVAITSQPNNARSVVGGSATFSVGTFNATTFQWQHDGVDISGATQASLTLSPVQLADAGTYHVTVGNSPAIPVTSSNVTLTVFPDIYARLVPLWSIAPGSRPYLTVDPSTTPYARFFAFNSPSNQILLVSRTNTTTLSTAGEIYVLNANDGTDLHQMDTTAVSGGTVVASGNLVLNTINVADDGAVYAANICDSTFDEFKLYRWDNSSSAATSVLVYDGQPWLSGTRWGDSMAIRGSGSGTEIILDNSTGAFGAIMDSLQSSLSGTATVFSNVIGGVVGGRALRFDTGNTFWEKHGGPLYKASYDLTPGVINSTIITNYTFPNSLGVSDFNWNMNLLAGLSFSTSTPDTLALYDLTDPSQPLLLANYNFPVNHNPNGNGCGRVVWAGERVFALDANNGLMAFTVVPRLSITPSGSDVTLSWSTNFTGYTLQASPSLSPPTTWTNVATGTIVGAQYSVTSTPAAANLFYRLQK